MSCEIYDKEYFHDDYSQQFSEMRDRYHARTQSALKRRAADKNPMPNATTVVMMKDMSDGGVCVTTGDFVSYFNEKYGRDRIGSVRRSLVQARQRSEMKRATLSADKKSVEQKQKKRSERKNFALRFSFARVALCFMLLLSVTMLLGTSLLLDNERQQVASLRNEVDLLESAVLGDEPQPAENDFAHLEALSLSEANSVEIYTPEEESAISVLLNALSSLGKE